jgi:hypothetical protein
MVVIFNDDPAPQVRERNQIDGPGSFLPPPAPFAMGLAFSSIAGLRLRAPCGRRVVNTKL